VSRRTRQRSERMKVVKLRAANLMNLTAVEITPGDETIVTVGGKNGAGKSSVLNAIAMALGGAALVPQEPIRGDETEGTAEVDLGDIVVTRRFKRDHLACDCGENVGIDKGKPDLEHKPDCASFKFGPTRSSLIVRAKQACDCEASGNAAKPKQHAADPHAKSCAVYTAPTYSSPQAMLDGLVGKLTFDPLAFSKAEETPQKVVLQKLVGLDTRQADAEYAMAYAERAKHNKTLADAQAKLKLLPRYEGVPALEVDVSALIEEIKKADELRTIANEAVGRYEGSKGTIVAREQSVDGQKRHLARLETELREAKEALERAHQELDAARADVQARAEQATVAQAAVPDTAVLNEKLRESTEVNKKVRANQAATAQEHVVAAVKGLIQTEEKRLEEAIAARRAALAAVKFPVPGLGFSEHGVTFNGKPLKQASTAEQVRVSVAIGLALNPKLRVLLVRDGSLLDTDSIKAITDQAAAADAQLWLEYMTENKEGVTVMIEDGAVV
jgi:hypothetical protein